MSRSNENKVHLSLKLEDRTIEVAFKHSDLTTDELLEAFLTLMKGAGFHEASVIESLELYLEEQKG